MTNRPVSKLKYGLIAALLLCAMSGYGASGRAGGAISTGKAGSEPAPTKVKKEQMMVYIGTYSDGTGIGIYQFHLDPSTGELTAAGGKTGVVNPSFLAIHPNRHFLYAVDEIGDYAGTRSGAVSAFSIAPETGDLTLLNQQSTKGDGPCHLTVDRKGKNLLVANYGGGSVAVLPIEADGKLGEASCFIQHTGTPADPARQGGPHAHSIYLDAANHYAIVSDLGLDKVFVYRFDPDKGMLTSNTPPFTTVAPRSGPRHFAFLPGQHFGFGINEIDCTITAYRYDAHHGTLSVLQTVSSLPEGYTVTGKDSTAEVVVHPSGKFLYGSNRGDDSIVIFAIDPETARLSYIGHQSTQGKTPRNFAIDPTGNFLIAANQNSDNVVVFRIDQQTGKLTPTGQSVEVSKPVCVVIMPK